MTESEKTESVSSESDGLRKELGLLGVFSLASGAMISSGLFVLPGLAFAIAGPAAVIAYVIASILMIPVALSKAELSTAMPKAGGTYFYVERSMGPLAGTLAGFSNWLSIAFKSIFALVGIGTIATLLVPDATPLQDAMVIKLSASIACVAFLLLNAVGTKESSTVQNIFVVALLVILCGYVASGFTRVVETNYIPFMPDAGWPAVFSVAGLVFVSYGGLTKIVSVSEEVRNPTRNLPLGMFLSFGIVSLLYVLVTFVTIGLVEPGELSGSLQPITLGARAMFGKPGVIAISIGALLAFATTANSGMLAASRAPMAMSRDGLLPAALAKTSKRFGTPLIALLLTSAFMILAILFLDIENLVKTASTMMLLMFMLVNVSIIIMRQSGVQNYRPTFKAPLYPWLQIFAIISYLFLIMEMGTLPLSLTAVFSIGAILWYFIYVRTKIERQSALVYMVKRILSRHIESADLDSELIKIVLERDEVAFDKFDHLVRDAVVLDYEEPIDALTLFKRISIKLSDRVGLEVDDLYQLFVDRERESSTVIETGLAIPHVILPGEGKFDIAMVRCRKGAFFSDLHPPVKMAFVLMGSMDERNYHLKALMTIAHIVREPDFKDRWMAAAGPQQLKDLILLSSRERDVPAKH